MTLLGPVFGIPVTNQQHMVVERSKRPGMELDDRKTPEGITVVIEDTHVLPVIPNHNLFFGRVDCGRPEQLTGPLAFSAEALDEFAPRIPGEDFSSGLIQYEQLSIRRENHVGVDGHIFFGDLGRRLVFLENREIGVGIGVDGGENEQETDVHDHGASF